MFAIRFFRGVDRLSAVECMSYASVRGAIRFYWPIDVGNKTMTTNIASNPPCCGRSAGVWAESREMFMRPIEYLTLPAPLDGSEFWFSTLPGFPVGDIRNDLDAISQWLMQYDNRPSMHGACRKVIEQLLLWCVVEQGHALSALGAEEIPLYVAFLSNIQPVGRWIAERGTKRASAQWRPFYQKNQSASSVAVALRLISLYMKWAGNKGLPNLGRVLHAIKIDASGARSPLRSENQPIASNKISVRNWLMLRKHLLDSQSDSLRGLQMLVAVELLYYVGITANQIQRLQWTALTPMYVEGVLVTWMIQVEQAPIDNSCAFSVGPLTQNLHRLFLVHTSTRTGVLRDIRDESCLRRKIVAAGPERLRAAVNSAKKRASEEAQSLELIEDARSLASLTLAQLRGGAFCAVVQAGHILDSIAVYKEPFLAFSRSMEPYARQFADVDLSRVLDATKSISRWIVANEENAGSAMLCSLWNSNRKPLWIDPSP